MRVQLPHEVEIQDPPVVAQPEFNPVEAILLEQIPPETGDPGVQEEVP